MTGKTSRHSRGSSSCQNIWSLLRHFKVKPKKLQFGTFTDPCSWESVAKSLRSCPTSVQSLELNMIYIKGAGDQQGHTGPRSSMTSLMSTIASSIIRRSSPPPPPPFPHYSVVCPLLSKLCQSSPHLVSLKFTVKPRQYNILNGMISHLTSSHIEDLRIILYYDSNLKSVIPLSTLADLLDDKSRFPALRMAIIGIAGKGETVDEWEQMQTIVREYFSALDARGVLKLHFAYLEGKVP